MKTLSPLGHLDTLQDLLTYYLGEVPNLDKINFSKTRACLWEITEIFEQVKLYKEEEIDWKIKDHYKTLVSSLAVIIRAELARSY